MAWCRYENQDMFHINFISQNFYEIMVTWLIVHELKHACDKSNFFITGSLYRDAIGYL